MLTRVSTIFPYLLITLLCVSGVELFYRGVERFVLKPVTTEQEVVVEVAEPAAGSLATPKKKVDFSIITRRNLFGPPPADIAASESETVPVNEDLEPTTLEVVLMGTIDGTEQGSRAVILNKKDRKQEIYQVGDSVEGALVKEIRRGKVVLTVNGRDEMLDMSEAAQYAKGSPQAATAPAVMRRRANVIPPRQVGSDAGQDTTAGPRVVRPSRRVVRPRNVVPTDATAEPPADVEAEMPPEVQEQDIQEPPVEEQGAVDQQDGGDLAPEETQDQFIEEPVAE